ncbi:MAG: ArsA-related P-loop ATPase [Acidobacteriota bacterium]
MLGKGGVGRSTIAAALATAAAARGERALIVEWAVADPIAPWFGAPAAGATPTAIAPRISVCNFTLDYALRAYFVDHLHVGLVYRRVIRARPVARLLEVAPGLAEMFFLGQLWWLVTLAEREAGFAFERIIVDAPATGHGTSLLDIPAKLAGMGAAGMLAVETRRVVELMADPARTGAIVVSLAEPLVVDETLELVPRVRERLGRAPLALVVNRSAAGIAEADDGWLAGVPLSERSRGALADIDRELRARVAIETDLCARVGCPSVSLPELPGLAARDVVQRLGGVG